MHPLITSLNKLFLKPAVLEFVQLINGRREGCKKSTYLSEVRHWPMLPHNSDFLCASHMQLRAVPIINVKSKHNEMLRTTASSNRIRVTVNFVRDLRLPSHFIWTTKGSLVESFSLNCKLRSFGVHAKVYLDQISKLERSSVSTRT